MPVLPGKSAHEMKLFTLDRYSNLVIRAPDGTAAPAQWPPDGASQWVVRVRAARPDSG